MAQHADGEYNDEYDSRLCPYCGEPFYGGTTATSYELADHVAIHHRNQRALRQLAELPASEDCTEDESARIKRGMRWLEHTDRYLFDELIERWMTEWAEVCDGL